jgi:hypothetical protein
MTKEQELEMAQDQLAIACENLANQKSHKAESFRLAAEEVEACIHALKAVQLQGTHTNPQNWRDGQTYENEKTKESANKNVDYCIFPDYTD